MRNIIFFSWLTIGILSLIISGCISVMRKDFEEREKIGATAILYFPVYCLLQYSCGFIHWTIRLDMFDRYPYRNLFCILVIIYCIIFFIISGICYIKYGKGKYGLKKALLFLLITHLVSLLLIMLFSPIKGWF